MNAPVPPFVLRDAQHEEDTAPDQRRRNWRTVFFALGAVVAAALVLTVLTRLGGVEGEGTAPDPRQAVTVITVGARAFTPEIALSGEARPVRDIHVVAPASGVRILELLADEGQMVRQGQALARLDTAVANAQIRSAQAAVAEARSAAIRARDEYNRAESIRDSGALSAEQIGQRRAAADAADARLAAAEAALAEANARLAGGYVRAPVAGLVIDRQATLGAPVDGQTLFRIAGGNDLEVAAQVAESDILALEIGQTATFRLVNGAEVDGRLRRLASSIDPRTRTGEALFSLPRDSQVRAGMYLRGEAVLPQRRTAAVPQTAVLFQNGDAYVYVVDQQNRVSRRMVQLGMRDSGWVEIRSGLPLNTRVAGAGAAFLQDGDSIRPVTADAPAARPAAAPAAANDAKTEGGEKAAALRGRAN
ncbi:MAG: efflux RND transporter periplasmic adaptor subunit [Alphaproteobacteria bacterium]|nr:efflux RND transporter periplasmic adaptor subunit [Alphaproteobacteria bacterium]